MPHPRYEVQLFDGYEKCSWTVGRKLETEIDQPMPENYEKCALYRKTYKCPKERITASARSSSIEVCSNCIVSRLAKQLTRQFMVSCSVMLQNNVCSGILLFGLDTSVFLELPQGNGAVSVIDYPQA
jgi:hypothetical protein